MIFGQVTEYFDAVVRLSIADSDNRLLVVDTILDTGYNGWLTLPRDLIAKMGLRWRRRGRAFLADGNETVFDVYEANVIWHGQPRRIPVDEAETTPLLGMRMTAGCELSIQVWTGGAVTIAETTTA